MTRPQTRVERSTENKRQFLVDGENQAIERRGDEKGGAESWLRVTRTWVAQQAKVHPDTFAGWANVLRLFLVAMQRRAAGDPRIWDDLQVYATTVTAQIPPQ
ncbi:hypothetical protein [Kitasatospora sp. NPDC002965]|uniref:hypothetical protein n=1 Tax=Kitasatospora sp. NPDC002965 TaxID=3154775 RepID=UPI0033B1EDC8